jgi:hypothetical protein
MTQGYSCAVSIGVDDLSDPFAQRASASDLKWDVRSDRQPIRHRVSSL